MATLNLDALSDDQKALAVQIGDAAVQAGIDPDLAIAQAYQESGLKHFVGDGKERKVIKSESDAIGVMQMTPATAKAYGYSAEDLLDPEKNIKAYTSAMGEYLKKYNKPDLAVMAYHQGEGPVDKLVETDDFKYIGPKGKDYLLSIGANYDFNTKTGKFEDEQGFEPTEPLPSGLDMPAAPAETPSAIGQAVDFATANPETTGLMAAPATAYTQRRLNQGAPQAPVLDEQLKMQQMQQAEELRKAQAESLGDAWTRKQAESAGDKWAAKVTGSMGPGGQSVTEAARNYRMQQQLSPTEAARFKVGREGIILPNAVEAAMNQESPLTRASRAAQAARAAKDAAIKGLMSPGKSSLLTGTSTALAGVYANEARERELAGDELGSMISRVKAVGAGIGGLPISPRFAPGMIAKGLGYGTVAGLEGAELLRDKYFPYRGVTKLKR